MIELQSFSQEDIKQFISWVTDERFLLQFAGPQYKIDSLQEQLLEQIKDSNSKMPQSLLYRVVDLLQNEVIGHIQLLRIDWDKRVATIGRVIIGNEEMRGKGIGAKVMDSLLKIAFGDLDFQEIYLSVYEFNLSAIKCYEKVGFESISIIENGTQYKGETWGVIRMAISKEKYCA